MAEQGVTITGPFGSAVTVQQPEVPEGPSQSFPFSAVPPADVPITEATSGFAPASAERRARGAQPEATVFEAFKAAAKTWTATRIYDRFSRPAMPVDPTFNRSEYRNHIPLQMTAEEGEFFDDTAHSAESAAYAVQYIQEQRAHQATGATSPVAFMAGQFIDPAWLTLPPVFKVGKFAGRTGAAITTGAVSGGLVEAQEGAVSDEEVTLAMLIGGGVAAGAYRSGKGIVAADPDFPAEVIRDLTSSIVTDAAVPATPHMRMVKPSVWEEVPVQAEPLAGHKTTELGDVVVAESAKEPGKFQVTFWDGKAGVGKPTQDAVYNTRAEAVQAFDEAGSGVVHTKPVVQAAGETVRRKVSDAVWEEVPPILHTSAVRTNLAEVAGAVDTVLDRRAKALGLGEKLQWNMRKTMASFGEAGKRIANLVYDNNSNLSRHSVESHYEAVLHDLRRGQVQFESRLRTESAAAGASTLRMTLPNTSREAYAIQSSIEREVAREMFRRDQAARTGAPSAWAGLSPRAKEMADILDNEVHAKALAELKAAGVEGAEELLPRPGYLSRKWNSAMMEDVLARFERAGLTRAQAQLKLSELVQTSLKRANDGMDDATAKSVGDAIIDRALARGYHEEVPDVARATADDGKAGFLKHRMDLDYDATVTVGRETVSIMDLIDTRISTIVDQYLQRVATQVAFAKKGLKKRADIDALREDLMRDPSLSAAQRAEAAELFDNTFAHLRGEPSGQKVNEKLRLYQAYSRSIVLGWSGLWQGTEYHTAMAEYGVLKTLKYGMQELPGFKQIMRPDKETAMSLNNVLAEHSVQSLRVRPFLSRYEDGFDMADNSAMQLSAQAVGQLVPYANMMKYVHHHQARLVGNLILDRVKLASGGNAKAREALAKYGLESPVMDKLAAEIKAKGFDVDAWDAAVWAEVRPAFAKMMDESVLKARLGDMPAFAKFDNVGKFIFTYRPFVLTAHNKVLAGRLSRDGAGAVGLGLLYQLPLAMAAVQSQAVLKGEELSESELVQRTVGQMGGIGLFSEPFKWATGQSNGVGSAGLIPADRGVRLFQSLINEDADRGLSTAISMIPLVHAIPFVNGLNSQIKE